MIRTFIGALALAAMCAVPAAADKIALVAGAHDYAELPDSPQARRTLEAAEVLGRSPAVTVDIGTNADATKIKEMTQQFVQMSRSSDGQAVILAGNFANNGVETFFLPPEMPTPNALNLYQEAVPLSLYLSLLKNAPAGGLLILSTGVADGPSGPNWSWGLGPLQAPENVAIIHGQHRAVASLVEDVLPNPRRNLNAAVSGASNLTVVGTLPDGAFLASSGLDVRLAETLAWELASSLNTADAYRAYLARFPSTEHSAEARQRIRDLTAPSPEQAEAALNLTRNQRSDVQRDLTVLGFDTRGIDGIFGPGSRTAIANWQRREELEVTRYLTGPQIARLHRQAEARRAELQREEEEKRRKERAADNAYWQQTGALDNEAGYRTYLDRYPSGIYADRAKAALERYAAERRKEERRLWETTVSADTVEAYRAYLRAYPRGMFADQAKERIAQLERRDDRRDTVEAAKAEEAAMNLSSIARLLVERRLTQSGYDVGVVDGNFDRNTREAIRAFQRDRGLEVTGFLTEETVGSLVAGGVLQLLNR